MCQSRSEGGIRCASHVKAALQNSEDALVDVVLAESKKAGIELPTKESKFEPSIDGYELEDRLMSNPQYKNAKAEKEIAETSDINFRNRVAAAIVEGNSDNLKDILYRGNPEVRRLIGERAIIMDAAEQKAKKANPLKRPFLIAEGKRKTEWATESLKFIRSSINKEVKMREKLQKQSGSVHLANSPYDFASVQASKENVRAHSENYNHYNEQLTKTYKSQIANENIRKDPKYQEALMSEAVVSSQAYGKWQEKNEEIKADYAITSENMDHVKTQIRLAEESNDKVKADGYRSKLAGLEAQKEKKIAENKKIAAQQEAEQKAREEALDKWTEERTKELQDK